MKKRPINAYTLLEDVVNKMDSEAQAQTVGEIKDIDHEECEDCDRIGFGCFTCGIRFEKNMIGGIKNG